MRIAGGTVLRRYMTNLERNMNAKNKAENQLYSYRQFNRASESPIQAARALRVRKGIYDLQTYQDNLKTANSIYETAESSIMKVSSIIQSVYEELVRGAHGTYNDDDAEIIASTIDQYSEEMVQLMNVVVADRRIFGGINSSSLAFKIEDGPSGKNAYYHGIPLNQYQDPSLFPYPGTSYTDIGIGIATGENYRIDPQSALPVTFNGAEILGCGLTGKSTTVNIESMVDGNEYSFDVSVGADRRTITFFGGVDSAATTKNINDAIVAVFGNNYVSVGAQSGLVVSRVAGSPDITFENTPPDKWPTGAAYDQADIKVTPTGFAGNVIQLVLDSAKALKDDDRFLAAQCADALFALQTNVSLTIAKIGNTEEFIEFNLDRTTNNLFTLTDQQNEIESAKPEEQITRIKVLESIFNASLNMGAQIVPMSIFSFIR